MKDLQQIGRTALFQGMSGEELEAALQSLQAEEKDYRKGQVILHAGKQTNRMGMVLEGSVSIESNDFWGNRTILSHVEPGQVFAETYALLHSEAMLVDAVANEKCRILFLDIQRLPESGALEGWQGKLIRNLLIISSQKNNHLSGRSCHTAPKSIRGRV
ncbi:MAG: cyclic nucleotide-binding domain-containing protein, partial [Clostridia bacterium]|nr:cyclic nucleotide-binding domain-containing protein [Clostridia bacterium]